MPTRRVSIEVEVLFPKSLPGRVEVELPDSVVAITCKRVNGEGFTAIAGPATEGNGQKSKRDIHFIRRNGAGPQGLRRDCQITVKGLTWDVYLGRVPVLC